jgi:hypothetical protein
LRARSKIVDFKEPTFADSLTIGQPIDISAAAPINQEIPYQRTSILTFGSRRCMSI